MKTDFTRASQHFAHQVAMVLAGLWIEIVLVLLTAATMVWLFRADEAHNRLSFAAAAAVLIAESFSWVFLLRARAGQAERNAALCDDPDEG